MQSAGFALVSGVKLKGPGAKSGKVKLQAGHKIHSIKGAKFMLLVCVCLLLLPAQQ